MPSMQEIYNNHSSKYDELVTHEDYKNNLNNYLLENFNFNGKTIIELGVGTGRVTKIFIELAKEVLCYDNSLHMLDKAKFNLNQFKSKIDFIQCNNHNISSINTKADFVIEGWSFGHSIVENQEGIETITEKLYNDCVNLLNKNGVLIIIETLGTNVSKASVKSQPLQKFYQLLVNSYGFHKKIIRTDYSFKSNEEAKRIMSFFFGNKIGDSLNFIEKGVVKEFTGIWSKQLS